jgi:hypothetical protein
MRNKERFTGTGDVGDLGAAMQAPRDGGPEIEIKRQGMEMPEPEASASPDSAADADDV